MFINYKISYNINIMNIYIINEKNYKIYNPKIHDLLNIYFKQFNNLYLTLNNAKKFITDNNKDNIKIIFYFHNLTDFGVQILDFIQKTNIKCKIYFFTFDWWIRGPKRHTTFITKIFKAKNYKVITFSNSIEQLCNYHNYDYSIYEKNIIFNNIWCCYNTSICKYNKDPIKKILLSGAIDKVAYPERYKIKDFNNLIYHNKSNSEINETTNKYVNSYSKILNKYLCCFTSSVYVFNKTEKCIKNTHMILQKVFEILASGSLLIYPLQEEKYIKKIGLINKKNCYLIDFSIELLGQINEILDPVNIYNINKIRYNGYIHAINNLTSLKKFNEIMEII
jgi:hypothetical protein